MTEHSSADLLPVYAPPEGGLQRLRRRRAAHERRHAPATGHWRLAAAASCGACLALILLALPPASIDSTALDRLRGVRATGTPLVLRDALAHAEPIATRQAGVRLYWTASLDVPADMTAEE
jgi:hypothetical protein